MRVVIDTTYLLPVFNINTRQFSKGDLRRFMEMNVRRLIAPPMLIEAKWVIYRLTKRLKLREVDVLIDFNEGLRFLKYSGKFLFLDFPDEHVDLEETNIYIRFGIKDFFDRLLLAYGSLYSDVILTEDKKLLSLREAKTKKFDEVYILSWKELSTLTDTS